MEPTRVGGPVEVEQHLRDIARPALSPRQTAALAPYVPRLVVDWLRNCPEQVHRSVSGTCVFADISGFTALTEKLAQRDKAGAEEMGDLLNRTFEHLLTSAYDYGANLVKWGGDAVLLLFDGDQHPARAARASWAMQATMARIGRLQTSSGSVRLKMSIGAHTGEFDFLLTGRQYRDLIVTGPAASTTARMEKIAQAGEVVISPALAAELDPSCLGAANGDGVLLERPPDIGLSPNRARKAADVDLRAAFPPALFDHLVTGTVDHEHRHITVGFVEFSGTDALAGAGATVMADAVVRVIESAQAAAAAHGVTILSTDICEDGGKLILVSGAPSAIGDDETRVLGAARRIVHPGGVLRLRAGVTRGRVFAGDYGPTYRRVYSITGDIVNLAARLMARAGDGEVIAMPDVVERSRTGFGTSRLEPFQVKGKVKPIEALLVGDLRREGDLGARNRLPLVGREPEMVTLVVADRLAATGRGQVVEIVGEAGMGKSRLIEELDSRSSSWLLWADGDIYGSSTPYQPMQRLFRHSLGLPQNASDAQVAKVLRDLTTQIAPDLLPWLPLVGIVAGADVGRTPEVDRLDPDVRKSRLEQVTSDLLGRVLTRPVMMVFNDVHFMDDATIDLLRRLCADVVTRQWMIVTTRRPDFAGPLEPAEHHTLLELEPLDAEAAAQLLTAATSGTSLPGYRMQQLAERAGGNPLFLREISAGVLSGDDMDALPDSIEGVIAARIDRLPPASRSWLRAAAVLGMVVDPAVLRAVLDDPARDGRHAEWSGLEEFIGPGEDGKLHFTHHLIRLTAYEGLPYRRRTILHARAADALETQSGLPADQNAALLSIHCLLGERFDAAWQYARSAGNRAREQYAGVEAADCYRRALGAAKHLPSLSSSELADVYAALADIEIELGEMENADTALRLARRAARTDPLRLASLMLMTARHRRYTGAHDNGLQWIKRAHRALRERTDPAAIRARAELSEFGAWISYDQGAYRTAQRWAEQSRDEARAVGDEFGEARAADILTVLGALAGRPWDDSAIRATLDVYERADDLRGKARCANRIGMAAYFAGRWSEALEYYAEAGASYRESGNDSSAAAMAANCAEVLIQQGRIGEAVSLLEPSLRVWTGAKATSFLGFGLRLRGHAAMEQGQFDEAADYLARSQALAAQMGETDEEISIDALQAEILLRRSDPAGALSAVAQAVLRVTPQMGTASAEPHLLRIRGEALYALDRPDDGELALIQSLRLSRERDSAYDTAATLLACLQLIDASPDEVADWVAAREEIVTKLGLAQTAV